MTVMPSVSEVVAPPLNPEELVVAERLRAAVAASNDQSSAISGALSLYRRYFMRVQPQLLILDGGAWALSAITEAAWRRFEPSWNSIVSTLFLRKIYQADLVTADARKIPSRVALLIAEDYSARLGTYFNASSSKAIVDGYSTMINRQMPAQVARARALELFGLTPRQVQSVIATAPDQKRTTVSRIDTARRRRHAIESYSRSRIATIADQENYNATKEAQQVIWMYRSSTGDIPKGTVRVWVTAEDELVCEQCGPMHKKEVPLLEPFVLPGGEKMWVPGAHVNCRCSVRLKRYSGKKQKVSKADDDWDPNNHPRSQDGRFRNKAIPATARKFSAAMRMEDTTEAAPEPEPLTFSSGPSFKSDYAFSSPTFSSGLKATPKFTSETKTPESSKTPLTFSSPVQGIAEIKQQFSSLTFESVAPAEEYNLSFSSPEQIQRATQPVGRISPARQQDIRMLPQVLTIAGDEDENPGLVTVISAEGYPTAIRSEYSANWNPSRDGNGSQVGQLQDIIGRRIDVAISRMSEKHFQYGERDENGEWVRANLSDQDFTTVMRAVASGDHSDVLLEFENGMDEVVNTRDVADQIGINQEDFVVDQYVAASYDAAGEFNDLIDGDTFGRDTVRMTGDFTVVRRLGEERLGDGEITVRTWEVIPTNPEGEPAIDPDDNDWIH